MALDLGELVARVTVDTTAADKGLTAFERRLLQSARRDVPSVVLDVDAVKAGRTVDDLVEELQSIPDRDVVVDAATEVALGAIDGVIDALRDIPDVDVDTTKAESALQGLDALGDTLARREFDPAVDVDITKAERKAAQITRDLDVLRRLEVTPEVTADITKAERSLARAEAELQALQGIRAEMTVTADTSQADSALADLNADAADGGAAAGKEAGDGLAAGVIAAIATIPVAGAIVGIGAAIGKSLLDGLQNEVRQDTLVATTGLNEADAARIGRAAGEAYAANFGDSIEGNFDTARAALQSGLLDPDSTARDSQAVIEQLSGVSAILGEDIPRVSRAVGVILKNGLAKDATEAFDILVKGQQAGANEAEDLLDTFTEYPAVLQRLGLDGADSLALISQGLQNGARDSDFVADALKEFQIRATDGSTASAAAFELLGLNADDATAKIARGGQDARDGLQEVLDGLRAIEDPVKRNEAAVGLFGTKAEDLGDALFALDLNKTATDLGKVEGAASGAIAALGDNSAGELESARRSIEIASDGIQGALAAAFGDDISDFATTVSTNRAAVVGFLLDMANAGLDVGRSLVEASASGVEGFGDMAAGTEPVLDGLASIVDAAADVAYGMGRRGLSSELREAADGIRAAGDQMGTLDEGSQTAADAMRTNLITNGIDPVQDRLNELGMDQVRQAEWHDATVRLADGVAGIGYAADGTRLAIDLTGGSFDKTTAAGAALDEQIRTASQALDDQVAAGQEAGRTVEELSADYDANREALLQQLEAMGFTREEAIALADSYGAIPDKVNTTVTAETAAAAAALEDIRQRIANIRDKNVTITTTQATSYVRQEQAMANRGNANPRTIDRRAKGGPVVRGEDYLVGEEGPEIVTMASDGYVIPAGPTAAILSGGYGQATPLSPPSTTTMTREGDRYDVNIYETSNPRATAREALVELRLAAFEKNGLG